MTVAASDDLRALREAVAALLDKRFTQSRVRELMATDTGIDDAAWADFADMGLLGLAVPAEFGGAGATHAARGVVAEEMGRVLVCGPYLSTAVLTPALLAATDDAGEQADVLPRIAAGTAMASVACTSSGGTMFGRTCTKAVRQAGLPSAREASILAFNTASPFGHQLWSSEGLVGVFDTALSANEPTTPVE